MSQIIDMPATSSITLDPSKGTFEFNVTSACTVCFSVNAAYGTLSGGTFNRQTGTWVDTNGQPWAMPTGPNTSIEFNCVAYNAACNLPPSGAKTIHIGSKR
jgi:hypothetical protein